MIELKRQSFDVPAGVDTGEHLKVTNGGNAGSRGGPSGHLFVAFRVAKGFPSLWFVGWCSVALGDWLRIRRDVSY